MNSLMLFCLALTFMVQTDSGVKWTQTPCVPCKGHSRIVENDQNDPHIRLEVSEDGRQLDVYILAAPGRTPATWRQSVSFQIERLADNSLKMSKPKGAVSRKHRCPLDMRQMGAEDPCTEIKDTPAQPLLLKKGLKMLEGVSDPEFRVFLAAIPAEPKSE